MRKLYTQHEVDPYSASEDQRLRIASPATPVSCCVSFAASFCTQRQSLVLGSEMFAPQDLCGRELNVARPTGYVDPNTAAANLAAMAANLQSTGATLSTGAKALLAPAQAQVLAPGVAPVAAAASSPNPAAVAVAAPTTVSLRRLTCWMEAMCYRCGVLPSTCAQSAIFSCCSATYVGRALTHQDREKLETTHFLP